MATIANVAKEAGVSASTVSYVLSGKRRIGQETTRRVLEAVETLGYQPNAAARALRSTETRVLALMGFVAAGHTEAAVTGMFIFAIAEAVRERGYDLLLIPSHEGIPGIERLSRTFMADAAMVMGIRMHDDRVDALRELGFPAALIGHPQEEPGINWVDLDFHAAGRLAVRHLADAGYPSVGFLGPPAQIYEVGSGYAVRALAGAQEAAAEHGVALHGPFHIDDAHEAGSAVTALFSAAPDAKGIVLHYQQSLPAVIRAVQATGRRVPDDVQVVLVGAWSTDRSESEVTYVSSTLQRMASTAVDLAIEAAGRMPPRSVLLQPEVWVSPERPGTVAADRPVGNNSTS